MRVQPNYQLSHLTLCTWDKASSKSSKFQPMAWTWQCKHGVAELSVHCIAGDSMVIAMGKIPQLSGFACGQSEPQACISNQVGGPT